MGAKDMQWHYTRMNIISFPTRKKLPQLVKEKMSESKDHTWCFNNDDQANVISPLSDWSRRYEINMAHTFAYFETNGEREYYFLAGKKTE